MAARKMKYVEDERSNNQNTRDQLYYHRLLKKFDWIQWISAAVGLTLLIFLGLAWKMQDLEMAFAMSLVAGRLVGYHA